MSFFFRVSPEVAGYFGAKTQIDRSFFPPKIEHLDFVFQGWMGDPIVECFPEFLVTEELRLELQESAVSGIDFLPVEVSFDPQFHEMFPEIVETMPRWHRLGVVGVPFRDDVWKDQDQRLCMMPKAMEILRKFDPADASCEEVHYLA